MSDLRYFYVPNALALGETATQNQTHSLSLGKESAHILKVLRMREGDPINIVDGKGHLIKAVLSGKGNFDIQDVEDKSPLWPRPIHLCVAPTKNIDRMEWLVEKAVEIGVDSISFVKCRYSERNSVNTERLTRIAASAMTQSHKYFLPEINDIVPFGDFIARFCGQFPNSLRFIAHCYDDIPRTYLLDVAAHNAPDNSSQNFSTSSQRSTVSSHDSATSSLIPATSLPNFTTPSHNPAPSLYNPDSSLHNPAPSSPNSAPSSPNPAPSLYNPTTYSHNSATSLPISYSDNAALLVCVGPEGDFSKPEVEQALKRGFLSVSLGTSRLRTETAALVAVHLMHLFSDFGRSK